MSDFKDTKELSNYLLQIADSSELVRKHTEWRRRKLAPPFAAMLRRSKHAKVCEVCDAVRARHASRSNTALGQRDGLARVLLDDTFVLVEA